MSDVIRAGGPTGRSSGGWTSPASFAVCTFYVSLVLWLTVWVLVPTGILGLRPMLVTSGSMSPLIRTGDVVLVGDHDAADLAPGTVVTFHDASRDGRLVTHRIDAVGDDGTYTTRGDANAAPDARPVRPADIVGVGRLLVPMIGIPLTWLYEGAAPLFLLWLVATLLAVVVASRAPGGERTDDEHAATDDPVDGSGSREPSPRRGHRWGRPGRATASLVVGLALLGVLVPRTSAAFTAATANTGNGFQAASALAAPTGLGVQDCRRDRGTTTVVLVWTAPSPPPAGYRVEWSVNGDPYEAIGTTGETSFAANGLQNGDSARFRVIATSPGAWDSAPSAPVAVTFQGNGCQ